jgi:SacI restriction endonuclease
VANPREKNSVSVNKTIAAERFRAAVVLAESDTPLPNEWLERTNRIGESPSQSFVALLGVAMLARATNSEVDPLTLHASQAVPTPGFKAYQPRGIGEQVLVPLSREYRVDLGRSGPQPFNNQPIYGSKRIEDMLDRVSITTRPHVEYLIGTLNRVRDLPEDELIPALAAFIRQRQKVGATRESQTRLEYAKVSTTFAEVLEKSVGFVHENSERGRRGQALVAAALELVYPRIECGVINDPSRHWPGDVHAFTDDNEDSPPLLAVEVRQKTVSDADLDIFARRVRDKGLVKAMVTALSATQPRIPESITQILLERYGVLVVVYDTPEDFLRAAATWSGRPLELWAREFPARMSDFLNLLDASPEGQNQWVAMFSDS